MSVSELSEAQRKFAKLSLLKHYDLLFSVFATYCKVGGDRHWLTLKGWTALCRDAFIADKKSAECSEAATKALFQRIYARHHAARAQRGGYAVKQTHQTTALKLSEWRDADPWSGVWKSSASESGGGGGETYKLKQVQRNTHIQMKSRLGDKLFRDECDIPRILCSESAHFVSMVSLCMVAGRERQIVSDKIWRMLPALPAIRRNVPIHQYPRRN